MKQNFRIQVGSSVSLLKDQEALTAHKCPCAQHKGRDGRDGREGQGGRGDGYRNFHCFSLGLRKMVRRRCTTFKNLRSKRIPRMKSPIPDRVPHPLSGKVVGAAPAQKTLSGRFSKRFVRACLTQVFLCTSWYGFPSDTTLAISAGFTNPLPTSALPNISFVKQPAAIVYCTYHRPAKNVVGQPLAPLLTVCVCVQQVIFCFDFDKC